MATIALAGKSGVGKTTVAGMVIKLNPTSSFTPMPTLLLIRHAENDYVEKGRLAGRLPGIHLNPTGRAQAQTLASHLAQTPLDA